MYPDIILGNSEILSSGIRTLQISKRNLLDICQITHLIFGKMFGKLGKEKCEYILFKTVRIFDWFENMIYKL